MDNELGESEKAIRILGGEIGKVCSFVLPETDFARTLVPIKKSNQQGKNIREKLAHLRKSHYNREAEHD